MASDIDKAVADLRAECEALREENGQLETLRDEEHERANKAESDAAELRSENAELRRERNRVCVLLREAGQDGIDIGDTGGCEWSAETFAGVIKRKMADFAEVRSAALPDEYPEDLAGPYGDGFDAATGALDLLCEQRDHANARAEEAEAREAGLLTSLESVLRLCARWEAYWDHPMREPAARVAVMGLIGKVREVVDG